MKKQVIILFTVIVLMLFSSCDSKTVDNEQTTDEIQGETYLAEITDTYDSDLQLFYDSFGLQHIPRTITGQRELRLKC